MTDPADGPDPGFSTSGPPPEGTGLAPNVAGALAYLLGPITGVIFLVLEKRNPFVRFHAAQSIGIFVFFLIFWIVVGIFTAVLTVIPVVGFLVNVVVAILSMLVGLAGFILWLFLMFQAWQGKEWEFPVVAEQARRLLLSGE